MTFPAGIDQTLLDSALGNGKAKEQDYFGLHYVRFTDDTKNIPRGTAVFGERVIWGYPSIGRILALESGLDANFSGSFWVEEKIDGYNTRIFRLDGRHWALTRGGFICPFTTDRIADLFDTAVFDHEPDLVLCAEVAGPDNPYLEGTPPFIDDDVELFVFDIMRFNAPEFLDQDNKLKRIAEYDLPAVENFGHFDRTQLDEVRQILMRLNDEGREGVVLKEASSRNRRVKFVTCNSDISDIRATAHKFAELPAEYFTGRVLRLALFMEELNLENNPDLARNLGSALVDGLFHAIEQFKTEGKVYYRYRCRFRDEVNAQRLIERLKHAHGHKVRVVPRDLRQEGDYWILEFDRIYPTMNGMMQQLLSGGLLFD